jgi:hypothetical protein
MGHEVLDSLPFPPTMTAGYGQTYSSPDGSGARISPMGSGVLDSANSPFFDNDGTSTARFRPDLAGKIFAITDHRNGTKEPKLLRCVQLCCSGGTSNGTTAVPGTAALVVATDPTNSGKNGYSRGTPLQMGNASYPATKGRLGVVVMNGGAGAAGAVAIAAGLTGVANTPDVAGAPSKPLYDGYAPGRILLVGDWVYVVEEGPCVVPLSGVAGAAFTAGKGAQADGAGAYKDAGDATVVVGTWILTNNTAVAVGVLGPYQGLLNVNRGYAYSKTGGAA